MPGAGYLSGAARGGRMPPAGSRRALVTTASTADVRPSLIYAAPIVPGAVLALHHAYRLAGGEERSVRLLSDLARAELGERVELLTRDSSDVSARQAARGLLLGGTAPEQVVRALEATGADVLHAHNLFPTFGPAALEAARGAGAAVVLHLHNSRLVCAVATNVRDRRDCTECRAGRPLPGLVHRCRGSLPEAAAYAAALPGWARRVLDAADVVVVPSRSHADRLRSSGLTLPAGRTFAVGGVAPALAPASSAAEGRYALAVGRLAEEKDLTTAIDACAVAGIPLVIAGDGPERAALEAHAARGPAQVAARLDPSVRSLLDAEPVQQGHVTFVGRARDAALASLRRDARVAVVTSLAHETFGLAALEAMAAGLPTAATAIGALPEIVGAEHTAPPRDAGALAALVARLAGDAEAGEAALARAARIGAPAAVARDLAAVYAAARDRRDARRGAGA